MISMKAKDWHLRYCVKMPKLLTPETDGWSFNFPLVTSGPLDSPKTPSVNYITTNIRKGTLAVGKTISMTFTINASEDVVFDYGVGPKNPCPRAANTRFYFQSGTGLDNNPNHRWWTNRVSADLITACNTTIVLQEELDPQFWINVDGKVGNTNAATHKGFLNAISSKKGAVGITIGGGCFAGHGACITRGSAKFIMLNYEVD